MGDPADGAAVMHADWRTAAFAPEDDIAFHGYHVMRTAQGRRGAIGLDGGLGFGGRAIGARLDRLLAGLPACAPGRPSGVLAFAA